MIVVGWLLHDWGAEIRQQDGASVAANAIVEVVARAVQT